MLYYDIVLHIRVDRWPALKGLFSTKNLGLQHLHGLTILPHTKRDAEWAWGALLGGFKRSKQLRSLRRTSCGSNHSLLARKIRELLREDGRIETADVHVDCASRVLRRLVSVEQLDRLARCAELFLHVRDVRQSNSSGDRFIVPEKGDGASFGVSASLRALFISFEPPHDTHEPYRDSITDDTLLLLDSTSWYQREETKFTLNITSLSLRNANFGTSNMDFWSNPVPSLDIFNRVTMVVLQDCLRCATLLAQLPTCTRRCILKRLVVISSGEEAIDSLRTAVESFLPTFEGLHTPVLSGFLDAVPSFETILHHASTLKVLYIDTMHEEDLHTTSRWIEDLCCCFTHLEQIALPMPRAIFGRTVFMESSHPQAIYMGGTHLAYESLPESWVTSTAWIHLVRRLTSISKLRKLITLRLLDPDPRTVTPHVCKRYRDALFNRCRPLVGFVVRKLSESRQSQLTVLAFGRDEHVLSFLVRGAHLKVHGEKMASVIMVCSDQARAEEPQSEILDVKHDDPGFLRLPKIKKQEETAAKARLRLREA